MQKNSDSPVFQPLTFKLISEQFQKGNTKSCIPMTIKSDNSQLIIADQNIIRIFSLSKGKARFSQIFIQTSLNIGTLSSLKKTLILSCSKDGNIFIWSSLLLANPKYLQKSSNHSKNILCLILNSKEDLIIYGSNDYSIKFYKYDQFTLLESYKLHSESICKLSMNQEGSKLISLDYTKLIIWSPQCYKTQTQWQAIQQIALNNYSQNVSVCFINNDLFYLLNFIRYGSEYLEFSYYEFFNEKFCISYSNQQSYNSNDGEINSQQPIICQYKSKGQILLNKAGNYIYLFELKFPSNKVWASSLMETIKIKYENSQVLLSEDGKYLIVVNQIQIQVYAIIDI